MYHKWIRVTRERVVYGKPADIGLRLFSAEGDFYPVCIYLVLFSPGNDTWFMISIHIHAWCYLAQEKGEMQFMVNLHMSV